VKPRVFLIGGFVETRFLSNSLLRKGYSVTAINDDREQCLKLAEIDRLKVYHGDGSKPNVLEDADIYDADIAIALTGRDDDNLVIADLCKKQFNVQRTVALISDPRKTDFFYLMGIDSVVCAVSMIASVLEEQAFFDETTTAISIGEKRVRVVQVHISEWSPVIGKTIGEVRLPDDVIVGCIVRNGQNLVSRETLRFVSGDVVLLLTTDEDEFAAIRKLTGR
jgi:trk system potassium uptake protein TrkA